MHEPKIRESDSVLLKHIDKSLADTAKQSERIAQFYLDRAEKIKALRPVVSGPAVPSRRVLRNIVETLGAAGIAHDGGEDDRTFGRFISGGWFSARVLLGEYIFHAGRGYDRQDDCAMRNYRIAIGELPPNPPIEDPRVTARRLEPYLRQMDPLFDSLKSIFREMRADGGV